MPEGQFHLAHAALYLATAPKSNSALGFFDALASVEAEAAEVPSHLKDASRDAKGFGHGEGYLYPHSYRDHWVAQQYLPDSLRGRVFYQPGALGFEAERRGSVLERREAQLASLFEPSAPESEEFVWSKEGEGKREWRARAESSAPARLSLIRRALYDRAAPARDDRVLVLDAREGYLVWEALRRCPEGTVAAAARDAEEAELIRQYASTLPEIERPLVAELPLPALAPSALETAFGFSRFDLAVGRDLLAASGRPGSGLSPASLLRLLAAALPGATLVLAESLPRESGRLSEVFAESIDTASAGTLREFEDWFYEKPELTALGPGRATLEGWLKESGLEPRLEVERATYPRFVARSDIDAWLSPSSAYGSALAEKAGQEVVARVAVSLASAVETASRRPLAWPISVLYAKLQLPS
jgi:putative ATPase